MSEPNEDTPTRGRITESLLGALGTIAAGSGAKAVFVYAEALHEGSPRPSLPEGTHLVYVTKNAREDELVGEATAIRVPDVKLTRFGQIKIAVLLAMSRGMVHRGDVVICSSGEANSQSLDTLVVIDVDENFELVAPAGFDGPLAPGIEPQVLARVLDLAVELGAEGREGKPVGALFVVGDAPRVLSMSRPLILNPFRGYAEDERNVLDPGLEETIKELASLDGAFVIRGDGVIESCGVLLKAGLAEASSLPAGLGTRHHAAAGITGVSDAVAIAVSESTGTVTIFRGGLVLTAIEKPRRIGPRATLL